MHGCSSGLRGRYDDFYCAECCRFRPWDNICVSHELLFWVWVSFMSVSCKFVKFPATQDVYFKCGSGHFKKRNIIYMDTELHTIKCTRWKPKTTISRFAASHWPLYPRAFLINCLIKFSYSSCVQNIIVCSDKCNKALHTCQLRPNQHSPNHYTDT